MLGKSIVVAYCKGHYGDFQTAAIGQEFVINEGCENLKEWIKSLGIPEYSA